MTAPISVYLSHAPEDRDVATQLAKHLRPQVNEGLIRLDLEGGSAAEDRADVILMLVSADYLPCDGDLGPLDRALYLRRRKGTWVVPVLLHRVDLAPIRPPLRYLPHNRVPVSEWPHVHGALADVAKGVRAVVGRITEARSALPRPEGAPGPAEPPLLSICAHEADLGPLRALERHLVPYEAQGRLRLFTPERLLAGEPLEDEERLSSARVIVLALSADFLAAPELVAQMRRAVERHHGGEAVVVAVRARPVAELPMALGGVPTLPADGRSVSSAADPDEAWSEIVRRLLDHLDPPVPSSEPAAGLPLPGLAPGAAAQSHAQSIDQLRRAFDASAVADPPRFTDRLSLGDTELWSAARADTALSEHRVGCLLELSRRGARGLPAFLAERLAELRAAPPSSDGDTVWRDGLILVLEQTPVKDPGLRARLADLLLAHGRRLRDEGAHTPLCSAMRRLGTLLGGAQAAPLGEFLRDEDDPLTRQAALQAVQTLFGKEPPAADEATATLAPLRERVRAVAREALSPDRVEGVAEASLAVSALRAALALDDAAAPELVDAMIALGRPHLLWLSLDQMANMLRAWEKSASPAAAPATDRLRERLGRLRAAMPQGLARGV